MASDETPRAPAWLKGIWRREAMIFADGRSDRTTSVHWGQTGSLYVDLRIPAGRPAARGRRSLEAFDNEELLRIAAQKGFAGHILMDGDRCTWIRYIDYQPGTGRPDSGRLRLEGETLYEEGDATSIVASSYREIYRHERKAQRLCAALRAVSAESSGGHREAVLVLIDDRFLYARDRAKPLPPAETLVDLVKAADGDRGQILFYLDCEISLGTIEAAGGWRIDASTLPFREGEPLFAAAAVRADGDGLEVNGNTGVTRWRIAESSLPSAELAQLLARGGARR